MADLPDYYTQTSIAEAEAAKFKGGLEVNLPAAPTSRDIYLATDTQVLWVCIADGVWTGFDAATLTEGILTLYANMLGGGFQIKNIADPTLAQDAATRAYVLAQDVIEAAARDAAILVETNARIAADALRLLLAGGTMAGNIIMGGHKVTGLGAPAAQDDALRYNRAEIRNAEIAAGAAIAYAKLNLALGIVNADVAAAAAIAYSKLNLTGALKKGDIEAAAGIEYSKLALAASIVMADFAAAIQNAANGIVVLDASADVPDAQIPGLAASKITSGRFPVARLPDVTDEYILVGTGTDMEERAVPIGIADNQKLTVADFQGKAATGTFTNPERINDNAIDASAFGDTIGKYCERDLGAPRYFTQWRQYGHTFVGAGGLYKITYYNEATEGWVDWITDIPNIGLEWSDWASGATIYAQKIRLVVTTVGDVYQNNMRELEIKY